MSLFLEYQKKMYEEIANLECEEINDAITSAHNVFHLIMGKLPENMTTINMLNLCAITGKHIARMYDYALVS